MPVIDVDAHFLEPHDWLERTAPDLAAQIAPPHTFMDFMRASTAPLLPLVAEHDRPADPAELMPPSFREVLRQLSELQPAALDESAHDPFYDGAARVDALDAAGIDVQFLNFTYASGGTLRAMQAGRADLIPDLQSAYNTFAATMVHGHTDRLIPVCRMHTPDIDWCIAELTRMRELGSRAFWVTENPDLSLTHPDYDRLWSAAEDLGMIAYVHVFFSRSGSPLPSWARNGRGVAAFTEGVAAVDQRLDVANFLAAMVFDGVFERHPRLRLIVAECGYSWFPPLLHALDRRVKGLGVDGSPEPSFYALPLLPSEYIARQVKISPLAGFTDTGLEFLSLAEAMERVPSPDLFVFSSDYPHPEGRHEAKALYGDHLPADASIRAGFYGQTMAGVLAG